MNHGTPPKQVREMQDVTEATSVSLRQHRLVVASSLSISHDATFRCIWRLSNRVSTVVRPPLNHLTVDISDQRRSRSSASLVGETSKYLPISSSTLFHLFRLSRRWLLSLLASLQRVNDDVKDRSGLYTNT